MSKEQNPFLSEEVGNLIKKSITYYYFFPRMQGIFSGYLPIYDPKTNVFEIPQPELKPIILRKLPPIDDMIKRMKNHNLFFETIFDEVLNSIPDLYQIDFSIYDPSTLKNKLETINSKELKKKFLDSIYIEKKIDKVLIMIEVLIQQKLSKKIKDYKDMFAKFLEIIKFIENNNYLYFLDNIKEFLNDDFYTLRDRNYNIVNQINYSLDLKSTSNREIKVNKSELILTADEIGILFNFLREVRIIQPNINNYDLSILLQNLTGFSKDNYEKALGIKYDDLLYYFNGKPSFKHLDRIENALDEIRKLINSKKLDKF